MFSHCLSSSLYIDLYSYLDQRRRALRAWIWVILGTIGASSCDDAGRVLVGRSSPRLRKVVFFVKECPFRSEVCVVDCLFALAR